MNGITGLEAVRAVLPVELAARLESLSGEDLSAVEELRLRRGFPLSVVFGQGERELGGPLVTESHLRSLLENVSQASAHTVLDQTRSGFVTLRGGHRLGLCGTVSRRDGGITSLRYLSSAALRVARAVEGQADSLLPALTENGTFQSTLILGPPGAGKTTLLRDLVRVLSDTLGIRVGLADERGEVAALWQGEAQFYVGRRTDVVDGCAKAEGLNMLLRGMGPQVLAADEITDRGDAAAMLDAVGCGVALLATAHGGCREDLSRRSAYRILAEAGAFRRAVILRRTASGRCCTVEVLE